MRTILALFLSAMMLVSIAPTASADTVKADFESQSIPAGWTASGITVKKDNNSFRASMSAGATLTTPTLKGLRSVSYLHRGSGNNKELLVEASADNGATWTTIGSVKVSSSTPYGSSTHPTGMPADAEVTVRFTCKSATIYLDDITLDYLTLADEPTKAPVLSAETVTGTSISLSITPGDGSGRIVAILPGSGAAWSPADGTAFPSPFPRRDGDATVIAAGDITTAVATGLEPATSYTVVAYEYNGADESINYLTSAPTVLSVSTLTVPVIIPASETLDFRNTLSGGSKELGLTLSGRFLNPASGTITVTSSSDDFTISLDGTTYSNTISIPYTDASLAGSVTVRFTPDAKQAYEGSLAISGGGAEATVTLRGNGADNDSREYFIAPDGNDSADGTIDHPWLNLQKAVNAARPGDIIYCRGGRYNFTTRDSSGKLTVRIKSSGTAEAPITISAWADEHPVFDFEQQLLDCKRDRSKVGDRGILLTGDYWHLYGLHITHAADNGIKLEGSHNRIERCEFSYCLDSGLQMGFGHDFSASGLGSKNDGSFCAYNDIIDCDSHHNCDYDTNYGSDADGFACKMHNGKGNRFIRCRAWRNGDDAWDLYETDFSVILIECWAWESGKAEDHTWVYDYFDKGPSFSGNGNGIKLGGNGTGGSSKGMHYAYNCIAFGCNKSGSTKGFDCNNHKDGHYIVGGLAFDNGYDFMFESGGSESSEFYNNVCFGRQEVVVGTESHNALGVTPNPGKTFYNNVVTGFSRADYESLAEADALAPRGEDGSLPRRFGRLKSGSKLIDAGIYIPVPYASEFPTLQQPVYGRARDLGPYECEAGELSGTQLIVTATSADSFEILNTGRDYVARVSSAVAAEGRLTIHAMDGRTVADTSLGRIEPCTELCHPIPATGLTPGIYVVTVDLGHTRITRKLTLRYL